MKIGLRADLYFCKMTKMRNFYQIFGRILVLEGQVMYQFCFCAKNAQFCGPNSDLLIDIPKR